MTDEQIIHLIDELAEYASHCGYSDYGLPNIFPEHLDEMVLIVRRCLYGSEEEG